MLAGGCTAAFDESMSNRKKSGLPKRPHLEIRLRAQSRGLLGGLKSYQAAGGVWRACSALEITSTYTSQGKRNAKDVGSLQAPMAAGSAPEHRPDVRSPKTASTKYLTAGSVHRAP
jgi:hypothetical protein